MLNKEATVFRPTSDPSCVPFPATAPALNDFELSVVEIFVDLVTLLGLPKSIGEIYGLLFASAAPLSFGEIEAKLRLSKGSVSQGLRALRDLGAVWEVGSDEMGGIGEKSGTAGGRVVGAARVDTVAVGKERGARWVAAVELRKLIGSLLRERMTPYLERQDQRVAAAGAALDKLLEESTTDHAGLLSGRLEKIQSWQSRARTVLPVIGKLL